ncbi:peptidoglycan-binding domain-containing protein [Streptomyces nogalater]|uniref:Peptidoglycan-binding domain-containing protein n=1 Tax=Streptomyces nogalater TaxID=38314 RepID=A0ABW0WIJ6_STRNO
MRRSAVKAFQRHHRLAVDGIVGPRTWAALRNG